MRTKKELIIECDRLHAENLLLKQEIERLKSSNEAYKFYMDSNTPVIPNEALRTKK